MPVGVAAAWALSVMRSRVRAGEHEAVIGKRQEHRWTHTDTQGLAGLAD